MAHVDHADSVQPWPEPVVPVESLVASGCTAIPTRYIKPPSQRPSPSSSSTSGAPSLNTRIPVIDLSCPDEPDTVRAISDACRDWGFFQATHHGVSSDLVRQMMGTWREFFRLPLEEKRRYANSPDTYEGYGSRVGIEKGAVLDWGDYYFFNFLPESARCLDKWPSHPESWKGTTEKYGHELAKLCRSVMRALSASLGLGEGRLQEVIGGEDIGATMRANFYSRCPQPDLTLGLSAHSDPGAITVLLLDDRVRGLQVRKGDAWIPVEPVADAFVVNIGDQIQVLSNGIYKSVEHRVVVNSSEDRFSLAFFYNPKSDVPLGPLPELVTAGRPPNYPTLTYAEYRIYIRTKGASGKSQLQSLQKPTS